MPSTNPKPKGQAVSRRVIAGRRRRVAELERDPTVQAAIRDALESERLGQGVRHQDLKPKNG